MKKISSLVLMLLVSATVAFSQAEQPVQVAENPNAPEISFETLVYDFGSVPLNGKAIHNFKFTNTGKEPLILQPPQSSCGCTAATTSNEPVLPGASGEIKVEYKTTSRPGPINKTVTVRSNAKNNSVVLRITGKVESDPAQQLPEKTQGEGTPVNK